MNKNQKTPTMESITFQSKEQADKFSKDWNYYIQNVMTDDDVINYVKNHKDSRYQFMLNGLTKKCFTDSKKLQLMNDVLLELFLLSNPIK